MHCQASVLPRFGCLRRSGFHQPYDERLPYMRFFLKAHKVILDGIANVEHAAYDSIWAESPTAINVKPHVR